MRPILAALVLALALTACSNGTVTGEEGPTVRIDVIADGLINPVGLAALPDGRLLVAEEGTGEGDTSAGVSLVEADGTVRRVVSGLPSGRDAGDLSGAPLVGVSPDGSLAYTAHFGSGALLTFPVPTAKTTAAAPPLAPGDLGERMTPLNDVRLTNPFDIAFDAAGAPVVTDASGNGVATVTDEGATRFLHRFGSLSDPENEALTIDPVPTGLVRIDDEYFVSLTGGCPYPEGSGRIVAIDGRRNERVVVEGLNMPIDVAVDGDGTVWVLEFARFEEGASCFTGTGYESETGRLSRIDADGRLVPVVTGLDYPGAVLPMPDGSLYVSEVFGGRVLRILLDPPAAAPPGPEQPALDSPLVFAEVAADVGIDFRHGAFSAGLSADPVAMMGGGLCWLDYDNDGWLDLYLVNSHSLDEVDAWNAEAGLPVNTLYRNQEGTFVRMDGSGAELAMRGNGCVAADLDDDGDTDIYVTADGPNALLRNEGNGQFTDVGAAAGVDAPEWSTAAAVGDVDGDGRPDLFVGGYIDLAVQVEKPVGAFPQDFPGIRDRLYVNDGDMRFREESAARGLEYETRTLGALFGDYDEDGDLDLYVANDGNPNRMYLNDGEGRFTDVTRQAGVGDSGSGMGVAGGDYDGDGALDLLVTNWEAELNALYRNQLFEGGDLTFQYTTSRIGIAGLGNGRTGWGTAWADFDLDTDLDMLIVHGRVPVTDLSTDPELVRLYGNLLAEGSPGQFREQTEQVGLREIGPLLSRGSAVADYDNDGDPDVAINTIGGAARLLRNDGGGRHWLLVDVGFAPGATVTVTLDDGLQLVRHQHVGSSYLASEDPRLHFGLGADAPVDVQVTWPNGQTTELASVGIDRIVRIEQ